MNVELVRTTTADGLRLDGAWRVAASPAPASSRVDAMVMLHGVGGNFYGSRLFDLLSDVLVDAGVGALRVNTRGHGAVSLIATEGGAVRAGAAFEVVDQCRHDVAAWVDFIRQRGYRRIGLCGHSLGAIKTLYALAHDAQLDVAAAVAISPPRLSYRAFQKGPAAPRFREAMSTAEMHLSEGHPEAMFLARFPFPLWISAASYVDKYGPQERYDILSMVDRLRVPCCCTFGRLELEKGGVAFAGLPEAIAARIAPEQPFQLRTIDGADHFYAGVERRLADEVMAWLASAS